MVAAEVQPGLDRVAFAQGVLRAEAQAVLLVANRLNRQFHDTIETLARCTGRIGVTGVGKSADVGQKIVGTLNSTGTRSYALDATRAMHGDLGAVHADDVILMLSHRGESDELLRLLPSLQQLAGATIAITSNGNSRLGRGCQQVLAYGDLTEACPNALAPSSSTTVMMALGDAIAFTLSEERSFRAHDFARFHPAGSLGRQLANVADVMRQGGELRLASASCTVRQVFAMAKHTGRRTGAVILLHDDGTLAGLFTDSDLARLFEDRADAQFDRPIADVMTKNPLTIPHTAKLGEAMNFMRLRKFSELPVVDEMHRPVGLLDITDVFGLPAEPPGEKPPVLRLVGGEAVYHAE